MGDKRKLQAEIDRCSKKVQEGMSNFKSFMQKLETAQNSNQRDRCESEMKKEIKRLQRNREQLKAWIASSDVKDKEPLYEVRRQIETFMEKFKMIEKENKAKTHTKEGLTLSEARDPERQRREQFRHWVNDILLQLSREKEELEAETETINSARGKKISKDNTSKLKDISEKIANHNYHVTNLEKLLRLVENQTVSMDSADSIKNDLEYYMECHTEEDFIHNDSVYDHLDLDSVNIAATIPTQSSSITQQMPSDNVASSTSKSQSVLMRHTHGVETIPEELDSVDSTTDNAKTFPSDSVTTLGISSKDEKIQVYLTHPEVNKTHNPAEDLPKPSTSLSNKQMTSNNQHSTTTPTKSETGSFRKYDKIKVYSNTATLIPTNPPLRPPQTSSTATTPIAKDHVIASHINTSSRKNSTLLPSVSTNDDIASKNINSSNIIPSHRRNNSAEVLYKTIGLSSCGSQFFNSNPSNKKSNYTPAPTSETDADLIDLTRFSTTNPSYIFSSQFNSSCGSCPSSSDCQERKDVSNEIYSEFFNRRLTTNDKRLVDEFDAFNNYDADSFNDELINTKHILHNCLTSFPIISPDCHNIATNRLFASPGFYFNLPNDVLLFIFYHYQGTFAQYMAAKVIKSRNWRFHNILQSWFQRTNEPDLVTSEFEEGGYYFYDFHKWTKKFLEPFRFNFVNLEDKKLL